LFIRAVSADPTSQPRGKMGATQTATLRFKDDDPDNPIKCIEIAHSSIHKHHYVNPDPQAKEVFTAYRWTTRHPGDFTSTDADGYLVAPNALTIDIDQHDVWAVAFQRRHNRYVEYLQQTEGFWKRLEKDVVKDICNTAIDVADLFDDDTTSALTAATDKVINQIFDHGDGDVIIENWVRWDEPVISFLIGEPKAHIESPHHETHCKTERFGDQDEKK
jgi:hypothetical protein